MLSSVLSSLFPEAYRLGPEAYGVKRDRYMDEAFDARRREFEDPYPAPPQADPAMSGREALGVGLAGLLAALAGAPAEGVNQGIAGFAGARKNERDREFQNRQAAHRAALEDRRRQAGLAGVDADQAEYRARVEDSRRTETLNQRAAMQREKQTEALRQEQAREKAMSDVQDALSNPRNVLAVEMAVRRAEQLGVKFDPQVVEQAKAQAAVAERTQQATAQHQRSLAYGRMVDDLQRALDAKIRQFESYTPQDEQNFKRAMEGIASLYPEFAAGLPPVPESAQTFRDRQFEEARRVVDQRLKLEGDSVRNRLTVAMANLAVAKRRVEIASRNADTYARSVAQKGVNDASAKLDKELEATERKLTMELKGAEAAQKSADAAWRRASNELSNDPENESLAKAVAERRKAFDAAVAKAQELRAQVGYVKEERASIPPAETPANAAAPQSRDEAALRAQAADAISRGAPRAAVAARFKQMTGKDL